MAQYRTASCHCIASRLCVSIFLVLACLLADCLLQGAQALKNLFSGMKKAGDASARANNAMMRDEDEYITGEEGLALEETERKRKLAKVSGCSLLCFACVEKHACGGCLHLRCRRYVLTHCLTDSLNGWLVDRRFVRDGHRLCTAQPQLQRKAVRYNALGQELSAAEKVTG